MLAAAFSLAHVGFPPTPALGEPAATAAGTPTHSGEVRYRNIIRKKLPQDSRSLALEFTVVALSKDGKEEVVDPDSHHFQIGESFLVKIKPQDDAYVYVFTEGPSGDKHCLLPADEEQPSLVKADAEISLPDDGGWFEFQPPAGNEKLVVIALKQPSPDLNLLASAAFRERGTRLATSDETKKQRAEAAVTAIRERGLKGVRTRGPVKKNLGSLTSEFDPLQGRVTHVEGPAEGETSSFAITAVGEKAGPPELIIDIPLRSQPADGVEK